MLTGEYSKVSLIVPIFNVEPYLEESLDSIACQTYQNFEVIMIDDGSTDSSGVIAKSFVTKDSRFQYIKTENKGQSHARNIGLGQVQGELIAFVDPDDSIEKDFLRKLVNQFDNDTLIVSYLFPSARPNKHKGKVTVDIFFSLMFSGVIGTVVWNKIFRTELLHGVRFPEGQVHEEIEFFREILPLINDYQMVIINDNNHYNYRTVREGNTASTFQPNRLVGAQDAFKLLLDLKSMKKKQSVEIINLDTLVFLKNYIQKVNNVELKKDASSLFNELYLHTNIIKCFFIKPIWLLSVIRFRFKLRWKNG